jgi:hypothetical protein
MQGKNRVKFRPSRTEQPRVGCHTMMIDLNQSPLSTSTDELTQACHSYVPRRIGSDLSFSEFADELTPAMFGDIVRCKWLPITLPMDGIER